MSKRKSNLTHGSLFSGVGGFDLGAEMSGIRTLWNCEFEEHKRKVLARHFPNTKQYTDVCTASDLEYVDIISGGFPCQDISIAKPIKRNEKSKGINGERSGLWREYERVIRQVRPRYIIFENSPMLTIRGLERVLCDLATLGYCCEWQCLPATSFGFNHRRERIYGIAYTSEERRKNNAKIFIELRKVLQQQPPRQNPISVPFKRFIGTSNYGNVRMDDGFSAQLDVRRIEDMGNAVIPLIAHYLFECIKKYDRNKQRLNNI